MRKILAIAAALMFVAAADAGAADLPRKAQVLAPAAAPLDTRTGWQGFYAGAGFGASGTGVNLLNLGSVSANGNFFDVVGGWESYNGTYLFGARASLGYDVLGPGGGAASAQFSDHFRARAGVVFGGNLAQLFNLAQPQWPGVLANGVPYVAVEYCHHGLQNGECTSVGMELPIAATRMTINGEVWNAQYQAASGLPGQSLSFENGVRVFGAYHFQ